MAKERKSDKGKVFQYVEPSQNEPSESDRAALEKVLKETLKQTPVDAIDQQLLQALRNVAQRYPGAALNLDPIVIELVDCILQNRLTMAGNSLALSPQMSQEIAVALYEAPASHKRLGRLWNFLLESLP